MKKGFKEFCIAEYQRLFLEIEKALSPTIRKSEARRRIAQKQAIRETSISAIKYYPDVEPSEIWKSIYVAHVYNVSEIIDSKIINAVISADNSWKKSSGHAFEEMIKELGNLSLEEHGIEIILQRDLNNYLKLEQITNEVRDLSWLREQVKSSIFDLYLAIKGVDSYKIFGCVQTKTSVRDRVTRDREPSINAMKAYFFSVALVLDGAFLKLPKFTNMVNGDSAEYKINGWHGLYVLTNEEIENDRIHRIDISMDAFVSDVVKAAKYWSKNRQWFNHEWRP